MANLFARERTNLIRGAITRREEVIVRGGVVTTRIKNKCNIILV